MISNIPLSTAEADIDGDGTEDTLKIERRFLSRFGKALVIKTSDGTFTYSMKELRPIKVQAADIDGDGRIEISVIVYKKTRLDPEYAIRPFFYNWHPEGLSPKWLGSALARPFEDIIFADIDDDGTWELVSIEITPEGNRLINAYKWSGFGFSGIGQSAEFAGIFEIKKGDFVKGRGHSIHVKAKKEKGWEWTELVFDRGNFVESEKNIID